MNGEGEDSYNHDKKYNPENKDTLGIVDVDVISDTKAKVILKADVFNKKTGNACVLPLIVKSGETGDVVHVDQGIVGTQ